MQMKVAFEAPASHLGNFNRESVINHFLKGAEGRGENRPPFQQLLSCLRKTCSGAVFVRRVNERFSSSENGA